MGPVSDVYSSPNQDTSGPNPTEAEEKDPASAVPQHAWESRQAWQEKEVPQHYRLDHKLSCILIMMLVNNETDNFLVIIHIIMKSTKDCWSSKFFLLIWVWGRHVRPHWKKNCFAWSKYLQMAIINHHIKAAISPCYRNISWCVKFSVDIRTAKGI